jgi:hypothetical protein
MFLCASFAGAFIANFLVAKIDHLHLLVGCHTIIAIMLVLCGHFINVGDEIQCTFAICMGLMAQ